MDTANQSRRLPTPLARFLVLCVIGIVLSIGGPYAAARHHAETIRYCGDHRGPKSIWFGTFGSGSAVLCADGTTDPYYGQTRIVADAAQLSFFAQMNLIAIWVLRISVAALTVAIALAIRWHWRG